MNEIRVGRKRFKFSINPINAIKYNVIIKGPLGLTTVAFPPYTRFSKTVNSLNKIFIGTSKFANTFFFKLQRILKGLIYGYFVQMEAQGVGFKFTRYYEAPHVITLSLGHTHSIVYKLPKNIHFRALKYKILLFSNSKALLSQTAERIKGFRLPDAYKGKGLKFTNEVLLLKPGKQRQK